MTQYTILKKTGTHADALAAIGAADLLGHLDPRIVELQDRFVIEPRRGLLPADLDDVDPGYEPIDRSSAVNDRMATILSRMKAFGGPNRLIERFSKMPRQLWAQRVWECLHGRPDFVFSAPLVQLFHPECCRGYSLLKPTGTNRGDKTKDRWAEPFLEWLRFRGYFAATAGWFADGDLRLYTPIPAITGYRGLASVMKDLRTLKLGGSSVKIDCRAILALTRILIETARIYQRPRESVRGMHVAHYKDMGQAHTLIAMEQLALPDWFELRTSAQAARWLETIEAHDTVLRRLNDTHSDEFALLKQYRMTLQWQTSDSIPVVIEFLAGYAALLFKRRSLDEWLLPQFSETNVAPILRRESSVRTSLRNPGFLAVAAALRVSTLGAQSARHNGRVDHREIRYALFSDLLRANQRDLPRRVSDFVESFNAESSRRHKMGLPAARITQQELDACLSAMEHLPRRVAAAALLCSIAGWRRVRAREAAAENAALEAIPA